MEKIDKAMLPPLPDNLEDCHKEIRRLYQVLYNERLHFEKKMEKAVNNHKSAKGELESYRKQYIEAQKELVQLKAKISALPIDL